MGAARNPQHTLPLQVAAVCYRRRGPSIEFLLVNTNGGNKWTFPKGDPELTLSHRESCRTRSLGRSRRHRQHRAASLLPLHSLQRRFLETTGSAGVCDQSIFARSRTGRGSCRDHAESHLVQPRRGQEDPGQGPRSQIRARTASGRRPRNRTNRPGKNRGRPLSHFSQLFLTPFVQRPHEMI